MGTHRQTIGRFGEDIAARFLQRRGATVLARNVRVGRDEIDLVVALEGSLIAVEVKTRICVDPSIQLTTDKERRLRDAAGRLRPRPHRIDLVTVEIRPSGALVRWLRDVA